MCVALDFMPQRNEVMLFVGFGIISIYCFIFTWMQAYKVKYHYVGVKTLNPLSFILVLHILLVGAVNTGTDKSQLLFCVFTDYSRVTKKVTSLQTTGMCQHWWLSRSKVFKIKKNKNPVRVVSSYIPHSRVVSVMISDRPVTNSVRFTNSVILYSCSYLYLWFKLEYFPTFANK